MRLIFRKQQHGTKPAGWQEAGGADVGPAQVCSPPVDVCCPCLSAGRVCWVKAHLCFCLCTSDRALLWRGTS